MRVNAKTSGVVSDERKIEKLSAGDTVMYASGQGWGWSGGAASGSVTPISGVASATGRVPLPSAYSLLSTFAGFA